MLPPGVLSARLLGGGWADTPDDPTEAALRSLEWAVIAAGRAAEVDRRRRLRDLAVEVEVAEQEQRARRDAERQARAVRVELARDRFARAGGEQPRPTVDLAAVDITTLRIERL